MQSLVKAYQEDQVEKQFEKWKIDMYEKNTHLFYIPTTRQSEEKEKIKGKLLREWTRSGILRKAILILRYMLWRQISFIHTAILPLNSLVKNHPSLIYFDNTIKKGNQGKEATALQSKTIKRKENSNGEERDDDPYPWGRTLR